MSEENEQTSHDIYLDAIEGLMSLLQMLVVSLGRTGKMDTADYARALLDYRDRLPPDSVAQTLFDRMLDLLVEEGADVLLRRSSMRLVSKSPDPAASDSGPVHSDGCDV